MSESNYFAVTVPESSKVVTIVAKKNGGGMETDYEYDSKTFLNDLIKPKN